MYVGTFIANSIALVFHEVTMVKKFKSQRRKYLST